MAKDKTNVIDINIESLILDAQDRSKEDLETVDALANNMKTVGQITPIVVTKIKSDNEDDEEKFYVIAGKRRIKAAEKIGMNKLKAVIVELDGDDPAVAVMSDNMYHRKVNPILQAKWMHKLLEDGSFKNQDELADAFGMSQTAISKRLALLDEPEEIQEAIEEGEVPAAAVSNIKKEKKKKIKTKEELKKTLDEGKYVKLSGSYLTPGGSVKPLDSIQIWVGNSDIKVTFKIATKGLAKRGLEKSISDEIDMIGDADLVKAIEKTRKQEFQT